MAKDKERHCRKCGAVIGIDDDRCQACGTANPVTFPWYAPVVGFAIIALIAWLLVDFSVLVGIFERLFD
jgi:RNA polymerase subunit RPABC4/transcription elongation factor Spt4